MKKIVLLLLFAFSPLTGFAKGLDVLTADGRTGAFSHYSSSEFGLGSIIVSGDLGGGTLTTQVSYDGGVTWVDLGTNCTFTVAGQCNYELHYNAVISGSLSGAASPNITFIQAQD